MEQQPHTENVLYLDEYRRAKWVVELNRARDLGQIALFNCEYDNDAQLLLFPIQEEPDGAA